MAPLQNPNLAIWPSDGGTGSGGGTTTGSTGGGGGDSGPPPGCVPSGNVGAVGDTCGVFVSATLGDDANEGRKGAPLRTLGAALIKAKGQPVYACAESFEESLSISADATLYGALDCKLGWVYNPEKKTQLNGGADEVALTISKAGTTVQVFDFAITSANAAKIGGSSIAVLVVQAEATFTRCHVVAGDGKAGTSGAVFRSSGRPGAEGLAGSDACTAKLVSGADSVANTCDDGDSISGLGGNGSTSVGGTGTSGMPDMKPNGGSGEGAAACSEGSAGQDGEAGTAGGGAKGIGTISAAGYTSVSGGDGEPGVLAQSGGGGGGAKGETTPNACAANMGGGASGGSGGSGGCGGKGGRGGKSGGASIALLSIDATLSFADVTLTPGKGGDGGDGGDGQLGGDGGKGGPAGKGVSGSTTVLKDACAGGPGGRGGQGGKGGGGSGGHALAIAATGKPVPMTGWTADPGTAGTGGKGDAGDRKKLGDGANGVAAACWSFPGGVECK